MNPNRVWRHVLARLILSLSFLALPGLAAAGDPPSCFGGSPTGIAVINDNGFTVPFSLYCRQPPISHVYGCEGEGAQEWPEGRLLHLGTKLCTCSAGFDSQQCPCGPLELTPGAGAADDGLPAGDPAASSVLPLPLPVGGGAQWCEHGSSSCAADPTVGEDGLVGIVPGPLNGQWTFTIRYTVTADVPAPTILLQLSRPPLPPLLDWFPVSAGAPGEVLKTYNLLSGWHEMQLTIYDAADCLFHPPGVPQFLYIGGETEDFEVCLGSGCTTPIVKYRSNH